MHALDYITVRCVMVVSSCCYIYIEHMKRTFRIDFAVTIEM